MKSVILKWLAAALAAGALAGLNAVLAAVGKPPVGVDPVVGILLVAVLVKAVSYLIGKLPVGE